MTSRRRADGTNLRAIGQSPRQLGTNPRALGRHAGAGTPRDVAAVQTARDTAMAVLRRAGVAWCYRCGDGGTVEAEAIGAGLFLPCGCRPVPAAVAERITARFGHHLRHAPHALEAPGVAGRLESLLRPPT